MYVCLCVISCYTAFCPFQLQVWPDSLPEGLSGLLELPLVVDHETTSKHTIVEVGGDEEEEEEEEEEELEEGEEEEELEVGEEEEVKGEEEEEGNEEHISGLDEDLQG